jgi:flavin-dependent dehydrogenase
MDNNLLIRARECGVTVMEEAKASRLLLNECTVKGVSLRSTAGDEDFFSEVTIDATGRARTLVRRLDDALERSHQRSRPRLVAFKAHLRNTRADQTACEIYFYPGGYGGLNRVEDDVSNICFIASAKDVRRCHSDPETLLREVVFKNARAAFALRDANIVTPWLSVSLETFGRQSLVPAAGLMTVGDAAAFIDPFTGSGMLMALESGELAAAAITRQRAQSFSFAQLAEEYRRAYASQFNSRLRVCRWLRRAAFVPQLAEAAIRLFGNDWLRLKLTRATRKTTTGYQPHTG